MFDGLLIHQSVMAQLEGLDGIDGGTVLLVGPAGLGKTTIARRLAAHRSGRAEGDGNTTIIGNGSDTIAIATARELMTELHLRAHGTSRRTVIIDGADYLTADAQNALLKTLEEPPHDCLIIMTAEDATKLLVTVRSRARIIELRRLTEAQVGEYLGAAAIGQAPFRAEASRRSGGAPALAVRLLEQTGLVEQLQTAEQIARAIPSYSRLDAMAEAAKLAGDATAATQTIAALAGTLKANTDADPHTRRTLIGALERFEARRRANVGLKPALEGLFLEVRHD